MNVPERKRSVWKIAALIVALPAILVAVFVLWIDAVGARRRAQMELQVRELRAEVQARDIWRPPIRGEGIPGNAWEDYDLALEVFMELRRATWEEVDLAYRGDPQADLSRIEALLQSSGSIFDHLRRGAQRTTFSNPHRWEEGLAIETGHLFEKYLAQLAACRARLLAREGRHVEAARLMMDVLQLGRDLRSDSIDSGRDWFDDVCEIAILELKDLLLVRDLSSQDLSSFGEELAMIDRHFPDPTQAWFNRVILLGHELLKPEEERVEKLRVSIWEYRRQAYCRRIADAEAFDNILSGVRKAAAAPRVSRKQEASFSMKLAEEHFTFRHPLVDGFLRGPHWGTRVSTRMRQAYLRLLRVGVHYRATGETLALEDPMGEGPLHLEVSGQRLKVWTVWRNGADDRGDDDGIGWAKGPPFPVPGKYHEAKDIVLEVDR